MCKLGMAKEGLLKRNLRFSVTAKFGYFCFVQTKMFVQTISLGLCHSKEEEGLNLNSLFTSLFTVIKYAVSALIYFVLTTAW